MGGWYLQPLKPYLIGYCQKTAQPTLNFPRMYYKTKTSAQVHMTKLKQHKNGPHTFTELCRQAYGGNNCVFSAGFVTGRGKPKVDTVYLKFEKDGAEPRWYLLTPDELQAIAWVSAGAVWSHLIQERMKKPEKIWNPYKGKKKPVRKK